MIDYKATLEIGSPSGNANHIWVSCDLTLETGGNWIARCPDTGVVVSRPTKAGAALALFAERLGIGMDGDLKP